MDIMRQALGLLVAVVIALAPQVARGSPDSGPPDSHPDYHALLALGVHYRYGGRAPETGFDCSGLVTHVFERAWGLQLPRSVREQAVLGVPIRGLRELQPGDLLFYNTRNSAYSHVGIYVGNGQFVHAPRSGRRVRSESVDSPYWKARFNGARRLAPPA